MMSGLQRGEAGANIYNEPLFGDYPEEHNVIFFMMSGLQGGEAEANIYGEPLFGDYL